jgi:hypothetical protein
LGRNLPAERVEALVNAAFLERDDGVIGDGNTFGAERAVEDFS